MLETRTGLSRRSFVSGLAVVGIGAVAGCTETPALTADVKLVTGYGIDTVTVDGSGSNFDVVVSLADTSIPGAGPVLGEPEDPSVAQLWTPAGALLDLRAVDPAAETVTFGSVGSGLDDSEPPLYGFTVALFSTGGTEMGTATFDVLEENNA